MFEFVVFSAEIRAYGYTRWSCSCGVSASSDGHTENKSIVYQLPQPSKSFLFIQGPNTQSFLNAVPMFLLFGETEKKPVSENRIFGFKKPDIFLFQKAAPGQKFDSPVKFGVLSYL